MNRSPSLADLQNEATWLELRSQVLTPTQASELVTTEQSRTEFLEGARLLGFDKRSPRAGDGGVGPTPVQLAIADMLAAGNRQNAVLEPRRTTKSSSIAAVMLGRCALRTDYSAAFTFATAGARASEFFNDELAKWIRVSYPEGSDRPFHLVIANGKEHIRWPHASQLRVVPPGEDSFRGKGLDFVWVDEAQRATPEQGASMLRGILPTMSTKAGAQLVVSGNAGSYRQDNLLWKVLELPGAGIMRHNINDDVDPEELEEWEPTADRPSGNLKALVQKYHPGLGWTTNLDYLEGDYRLEPGAFPMEYLDLWGSEGSNVGLIPQPLWLNSALPAWTEAPAVSALCVFVHPDADWASLVQAWKDKEGRTHIALLHHQDGVKGFAKQVVQIARKLNRPITWDSASPATTNVMTEVREARPRPAERPMVFKDVKRAAVHFMTLLREDKLRHYAQPELDNAAAIVVKRQMGQGNAWGFGRPKRQDSADITPIEAAALAAYALEDERAAAPVRIDFFDAA